MNDGRIGHHPMANMELYRALSQRAVPIRSVGALAKKLGADRGHLSAVLNGHRKGKETWPLLAKFLTKHEYDIAWKFAVQAAGTTAPESSGQS